MKKLREIVVTTIVGGVLFLIPVAILVFAVGKVFEVMRWVTEPLDVLLPIDTIAGYAAVDVLAGVLLVLICFVAGIVARSERGRRVRQRLDRFLLEVIPGYTWVRGITGSISDNEVEDLLKPVMARFDDQCQVAFEVDRTQDGLVVVYLPGAPNARSGSVSYMAADRIQPIDAWFHTVANSFRRFGRGSGGLVETTKI